MKLTCHSCGAKYTVSDDKIQGKTVKMKCRKCGSTIVVGGSQTEGSQSDQLQGGDAASPPVGSFLVNVTDGDQRTMTLGEIVEAHRSGVVTDDTYVWADGMTDWQAIAEHAEVSAAVHGGAVHAQGPAPAVDDLGATVALPPTGGQSSPGYGSTPSSPGYGSTPSSPGYGSTPSSPGYGSTPSSPGYEAPRAAAKKEGKASRDLFGQERPVTGGGLFGSSGGGGGGGSLQSNAASGKRDENSVLFSLSALTATEPSASAGKTTAKKDDSGLIDLKALAASAPATPSAASSNDALGLGMLPDAGAVFPLGMPLPPPPQAAPAVGVDVAPPPAKSKLPLVIGGIVALCAMIGVFFLVKGDPPPPPVPTPVQTVAAPAPTPEPPPPAVEPTAEPTATASASASAPVAARPTGKWPPPRATAKPPSGGDAPAAGGAPKPPPPAKSKCGCAPSDLMCNMKCSAGKK